MSIFFAAYSFDGSGISAGLVDRVKSTIGAECRPVGVRTERGLLVQSDLKIWPDSSVRTVGESVVVVGGDPVYCAEGPRRIGGRAASIDVISAIALAGDLTALRSAEGTFNFAALDAQNDRLVFAVSKLAVRPVYYSLHGGVMYVASAMWILEQLQECPKLSDVRGLVEIAAFGAPLGDRTRYVGISSLDSGMAIECSKDGVKPIRYWDWRKASAQARTQTEDELLDAVDSTFRSAVEDREEGKQRAVAFLSGGMDSRLIVSYLRDIGRDVETINFAPSGSADMVYGRLAAKVMGTTHFEVGGVEPRGRWREAVDLWRSAGAPGDPGPSRNERVIWSGDGGSVGLGHVYMSDSIVAAARNRGLKAAAELIQQENKFFVSPSLFARKHRALVCTPLDGIREELHRCEALEPGRACHMFFMLNDQRRHLTRFYEDIHRSRLDYHLPFFDGRVLATILGARIDPFLRHRLYNKLLERRPFGIGKVPWQSYPGHEPCPVAPDPSLRLQWRDGWFDPQVAAAVRRQAAGRLLSQLGSSTFPSDFLSRPNLFVASLLTRLGFRDYSYLVKTATVLISARN